MNIGEAKIPQDDAEARQMKADAQWSSMAWRERKVQGAFWNAVAHADQPAAERALARGAVLDMGIPSKEFPGSKERTGAFDSSVFGQLGEMGPKGASALLMALASGKARTARYLVERGADPKVVAARGDNALLCALISQSPECFDLVKELGALNHGRSAKARGSFTPLTAAAHWGSAKVLREVLSESSWVDRPDGYSMTALMWASARGHAKAVEVLLSAGANPNEIPMENRKVDAFRWASRIGHVDIMKMLSAKGALVDRKADGGLTALMEAVGKKDGKKVEALLALGADPRAKRGVENDGETVLGLACKEGWAHHIQKLLDAGVDPNDAGVGKTPYMEILGGMSARNWMSLSECVSLLSRSGSDIDAKDSKGDWPLKSAYARGNESALDAVLAAGPNLEVEDEAGRTLLEIACMRGSGPSSYVDGKRVSKLLAAGAQVRDELLAVAGNKEWRASARGDASWADEVHKYGLAQKEAMEMGLELPAGRSEPRARFRI